VGRGVSGKQLLSTPRKLSLELGGKSPFIIFEDVGSRRGCGMSVGLIWLNQGQVFCSGSRLADAESIARDGPAAGSRMHLRVGRAARQSDQISARIVARVQA